MNRIRAYPFFAILFILSPGCGRLPHRTAGFSVEGRPIPYQVLGHGRDTVLILATIHGNEDAGTPLLHQLEAYLKWRPHNLKNRRVILMPLVNPDGYVHQRRRNARGVDLNRNFPSDNFSSRSRHGDSPLSEPESRALLSIIEKYRPDRIVSIHQPLECIDYDGPASQLALMMSRWTDLPIVQLGGLEGSLGSYAGVDREIPIITLELPRSASRLNEEELWKKYGFSLLAAIRFPRNEQ